MSRYRDIVGATSVARKVLADFGAMALLCFLANKVFERCSRARIIVVQVRDVQLLGKQESQLPAGYASAVFRPGSMGRLSGACARELVPGFLNAAAVNDDKCVAIVANDEVVSYQWLSRKPTWAFDDIWVAFGPHFLYGYNSFTDPGHRGRRLNRSSVLEAAKRIPTPEDIGLVGYVMASNISSLRAHSRVSDCRSGFALIWPLGSQRTLVLATRACRQAGFRVLRRPRPW